MYSGRVEMLLGGIHDYIGQIDDSPHPRGEGWYRIKNPCHLFLSTDLGKDNLVAYMAGEPGERSYKEIVDVKIPGRVEIRQLDKNGPLYKIYKGEVKKKESVIIKPGGPGVVSLN